MEDFDLGFGLEFEEEDGRDEARGPGIERNEANPQDPPSPEILGEWMEDPSPEEAERIEEIHRKVAEPNPIAPTGRGEIQDPLELPAPSQKALAAEILEAALETENGISLEFASYSEAAKIRKACYRIRAKERENAKIIFDRKDPRYGKSPYDHLEFWIRPKVPPDRIEILFHGKRGEFRTVEEFIRIKRRRGRANGELEYQEAVPDKRKCSVRVIGEGGKVEVSIVGANSFREAWAIIRDNYPAELLIINRRSFLKNARTL